MKWAALQNAGRLVSLSKRLFDKLVDGEASSPATTTPSRFCLSPADSGRKICKETIFALENKIFRRKNRPAPSVHAAGLDWKFERASTLSSSPRVF